MKNQELDTNGGVEWAADYVMERVSVSPERLEIETRVDYERDGRLITFGYLDAYCDGHLFDLKTGLVNRDYLPQMAVYAAAICHRDSLKGVTVHVLYSESKTAYSCYLSREQAREIVDDIVNRAESDDRTETPCSYCSWCDRRGECPAIKREVAAIADASDMKLPPIGKLSEVKDPKVMAELRDIASIAKLWAGEVYKCSLEFGELPGYMKFTRDSGTQFAKDKTGEIYKAMRSKELVTGASTISFTKMVALYAKKCGVTIKEAKSDLSVLLADFIVDGRKTEYWRKR